MTLVLITDLAKLYTNLLSYLVSIINKTYFLIIHAYKTNKFTSNKLELMQLYNSSTFLCYITCKLFHVLSCYIDL